MLTSFPTLTFRYFIGLHDVTDQVAGIKKCISEVFSELRDKIDQKEQEMMKEADDFIDENTKQMSNLLRLANGRAMNLSSYVQSIKDVLQDYDPQATCEYFAKNHQSIKDSAKSGLPELQQISSQTQSKFQINTQNISDVLDEIKNLRVNFGSLNLEMKENANPHRGTAIYEERGKNMNSHQQQQQPSQSVFELGYKQNSNLKSSVAKTMNNIMANVNKNSNFRNSVQESEYSGHRMYNEEEHEDHDFDFIRR